MPGLREDTEAGSVCGLEHAAPGTAPFRCTYLLYRYRQLILSSCTATIELHSNCFLFRTYHSSTRSSHAVTLSVSSNHRAVPVPVVSTVQLHFNKQPCGMRWQSLSVSSPMTMRSVSCREGQPILAALVSCSWCCTSLTQLRESLSTWRVDKT